MTLAVSSIRIYPVKSTAGLCLDRATVMAAGLEHDRRWMLVDRDGRFLTAREHPALVRVKATPCDDGLLLEAPGVTPLTIDDARGAGAPVTVTVWRDTVSARRVAAQADDWFGERLGLSCTLVALPDDAHRAVDPDYARPGDGVSFADGFPLLLIGDASLAELNTRTPRPVDMSRFRPNLTVSGGAAFDEDGWRRIEVGSVSFDVPKPSDRCVLTTVDPDSGEKDPDLEPLRTLSGFRRDGKRGILFGVNLLPRGSGTIHAGDPVRILE